MNNWLQGIYVWRGWNDHVDDFLEDKGDDLLSVRIALKRLFILSRDIWNYERVKVNSRNGFRNFRGHGVMRMNNPLFSKNLKPYKDLLLRLCRKLSWLYSYPFMYIESLVNKSLKVYIDKYEAWVIRRRRIISANIVLKIKKKRRRCIVRRFLVLLRCVFVFKRSGIMRRVIKSTLDYILDKVSTMSDSIDAMMNKQLRMNGPLRDKMIHNGMSPDEADSIIQQINPNAKRSLLYNGMRSNKYLMSFQHQENVNRFDKHVINTTIYNNSCHPISLVNEDDGVNAIIMMLCYLRNLFDVGRVNNNQQRHIVWLFADVDLIYGGHVETSRTKCIMEVTFEKRFTESDILSIIRRYSSSVVTESVQGSSPENADVVDVVINYGTLRAEYMSYRSHMNKKQRRALRDRIR